MFSHVRVAFRFLLTMCGVALVLFGALTGCATPRQGERAAVSASENCLAEYLRGADLQVETDGQRAELRRALREMLTLSPAALRSARYADYQGRPGKWTAVELLHRYFLPVRDVLDDDCFYRSVSTPRARAAIQRRLAALERPA